MNDFKSIMVDEIRGKFAGKWRLEKSENLDAFMEIMGVNFMARKMAKLAKPDCEICVDEDGTISVATTSSLMNNSQRFKLRQEFEEIGSFNKKKFKNLATFENGKLRVKPTPVDNVTSPYPDYSEREITEDGEMLLVVKVQDVLFKRWFKKIQ